ncbi:MAG: hypothetical protein QJR01_06105 [Kyrpidia sp.]|nr:hypothetical protein [Kyrpidia sp.]
MEELSHGNLGIGGAGGGGAGGGETARAGGIATVTLFGAVIGGIGFGMLADAIGRVGQS